MRAATVYLRTVDRKIYKIKILLVLTTPQRRESNPSRIGGMLQLTLHQHCSPPKPNVGPKLMSVW